MSKVISTIWGLETVNYNCQGAARSLPQLAKNLEDWIIAIGQGAARGLPEVAKKLSKELFLNLQKELELQEQEL